MDDTTAQAIGTMLEVARGLDVYQVLGVPCPKCDGWWFGDIEDATDGGPQLAVCCVCGHDWVTRMGEGT